MKPDNLDSQKCPLCHSSAKPILRPKFLICDLCQGIFCIDEYIPTPQIELEHYKKHNNDINDIRYQNFATPITSSIISQYSPGSVGLDFGSGTRSVIAKILTDYGFKIFQYDPYFHNNTSVLGNKYNFITCCEVIEHFRYPEKEFALLKSLVENFGHIYCMTHLYNMKIDFEKWYYKNDPTHVFFYQESTMEWIKHHFGFSSLEIKNRLIILKK